MRNRLFEALPREIRHELDEWTQQGSLARGDGSLPCAESALFRAALDTLARRARRLFARAALRACDH